MQDNKKLSIFRKFLAYSQIFGFSTIRLSEIGKEQISLRITSVDNNLFKFN